MDFSLNGGLAITPQDRTAHVGARVKMSKCSAKAAPPRHMVCTWSISARYGSWSSKSEGNIMPNLDPNAPAQPNNPSVRAAK
jgi:hypothetical protein